MLFMTWKKLLATLLLIRFKMKYASDLKSTLSAAPIVNDNNLISELYGFIHSAGSISFLGRGKVKLVFSCDNASVARRYFSVIKEIFGTSPLLYIKKGSNLKKTNFYILDFEDEFSSIEILSFYKIFDTYDSMLKTDINSEFVQTKLMQSAYLKGIFLGCAYINSPSKSYHLEFKINNLKKAKYICDLLRRNNVIANILKRTEYISVYVKKRESVATFLAFIGAHKAMMDFENYFILKDIRNETVRLVNSETANINKTVNSSELQISAIQKISALKGLDYLNERLREAAFLRLQYPSSPLSELCGYFSPKISRTAAYNRYSQIIKIADNL